VSALSPSAVIGLREALTGEARAKRARQLATPSWLSTRAKPVVERRPPFSMLTRPSSRQRQPGARYRGRKFSIFLACAPCWCRREAGRLRNARSESADAPASSRSSPSVPRFASTSSPATRNPNPARRPAEQTAHLPFARPARARRRLSAGRSRTARRVDDVTPRCRASAYVPARFRPAGKAFPRERLLVFARSSTQASTCRVAQPGDRRVTCDDARVAPGDLTRDQLIEIVDRIMRCDPPDDDEQDKLLWLFENNVLHPSASLFIYFPEHALGPEYEGRSLTARASGRARPG
jgi:hypothetical protein